MKRYKIERLKEQVKLVKRQAAEGYGMDQIKSLNDEIGHNFFAPDSMRYFKSRVLDDVTLRGNKAFFITSERYDGLTPRLFSIRAIRLDCREVSRLGTIDTIGDFQEYTTAYQARKALKAIKDGEFCNDCLTLPSYIHNHKKIIAA